MQVASHYLVEFNEVQNAVLDEARGRRYVIEGLFIQTGTVNNNKRYYPKGVVKPGVDKYIAEMVSRNRAVGELNHPHPSTLEIDYKNVSHKIESLVDDPNGWRGRAVVTKNTPSGAIVAGLMDEGVVMAISSRARGDTRRRADGVVEVTGNYRLATAGDIVSDPGAPDAFLTNLMEGKEWAWANGALVPLEREIKASVNKAARSGLTDEKMRVLYEHIIAKVRS